MSPRVCPQCNQPFTPRYKSQQLCSRACRDAKARQRLAELRAQGKDPAHGGKAAEARRQSLARRRAAGELLGRAAAKAKRAGQPTKPNAPAPPNVQPETIAEKAASWRQSALRFEQRTQTALRKDTTTLILAGYGASLRVEHDALIVKEGHTHDPQTTITHVLHRAMHNVGRIVCIDCKGAISFDALRWCASQNIAVSLLDRHGHLLTRA